MNDPITVGIKVKRGRPKGKATKVRLDGRKEQKPNAAIRNRGRVSALGEFKGSTKCQAIVDEYGNVINTKKLEASKNLHMVLNRAGIEFADELKEIWPGLTASDKTKFLIGCMPYMFPKMIPIEMKEDERNSASKILIDIDTSELLKKAVPN
jgi:hypothetical protein